VCVVKLVRLLLVAVGLFLLSGCVSEPVLELYGARISSASPQGVGLTMMMKVTNHNAFDVKVRNVRASVSVADRFSLPFLQYNPDQWLNANQSTIVNVPLVIPWQLVGPLVSASIGSNSVRYHVHGYADVTAVRLLGIERNDYELNEDGAFSRMDLLMAAGRGFLSDAPRGDDGSTDEVAALGP
jgi:hypothetical protein